MDHPFKREQEPIPPVESLIHFLDQHTRHFVFLGFITLLTVAYLANRRTQIGTRYLGETAHPASLAYVRVIVFAGWMITQETRLPTGYAGLPKDLVMPPLGWSPVLKFLPVNPLRPTRGIIAAVGLVFHNLTFLTMRIGFWGLQFLYLLFIDWHRVFGAAGRRLWPETLVVRDDETSARSRRIVSLFSLVDPTQRVRYEGNPGSGLRATLGDVEFAGMQAVKAIAIRNPLLWPLVPFLGLPAIRRRLDLPSDPSLPLSERSTFEPKPVLTPSFTLKTVSVGLLAACWLAGLSGITRSWPIACFPTFVYDPGPTRSVTIVRYSDHGAARKWILDDSPTYRHRFGPERWVGLLGSIQQQKAKQRDRMLQALRTVLERDHPEIASASNVSFIDRKAPYFTKKLKRGIASLKCEHHRTIELCA